MTFFPLRDPPAAVGRTLLNSGEVRVVRRHSGEELVDVLSGSGRDQWGVLISGEAARKPALRVLAGNMGGDCTRTSRLMRAALRSLAHG